MVHQSISAPGRRSTLTDFTGKKSGKGETGTRPLPIPNKFLLLQDQQNPHCGNESKEIHRGPGRTDQKAGSKGF
jgi:hypothetical protein